MTGSTDAVYPEPAFWIYSASGKSVGYGSHPVEGVYEIYLPGGEEDGWLGAVDNNVIEFSNGEPAGRVVGERILFEDGQLAGMVRGDEVRGPAGELISKTIGNASPAARGGAVLLLILNRWFNPDGTANRNVR
jgi:hypothetical protein